MSKETKKAGHKVPKLRFPEFRDAGEWRNKQMDELYSFEGTNSLSRDKLNYECGSVKNIHYGDIHIKFAPLFDIRNERVPFINLSEPIERINSNNFCVEGDMIFADASENLDDIGKSIELVQLNDERLLSGSHTILARQNDDNLVVGFGGHLFQATRIRTQIKKEAQGAKILGISPSRLSKIEVCYPSDKREQQKIADCLSSIDELVTLETQKLDTLKAHKKGLMKQLFPTEGGTVPRLRFPEFREAGEWAEAKLGDTGKFTGGGTPNKENASYWEGNNPWISSSDIFEDSVHDITISRFISDEAVQKTATKLVPANSILLVSRVGVGKLAITKQPICTSQDFTSFTPAKDDLVFMAYYLKSLKNTFLSFNQGMAIKGFTKEDVSSLEICFPQLREQQKIADCLSFIDELITAQAQKIDMLIAHKKGLMQQLFPCSESSVDVNHG